MRSSGRQERRTETTGGGEAHRVRFPPALLLCYLLEIVQWHVKGTFS